jgi:hypothetical protein
LKRSAKEVRAKLVLLKVGSREEDITEARARRDAGKARLDEAAARLAYCTVAAPISGVILNLLADLLWCRGLGSAADTSSAQRLHQVYDVLALPLLRRDRPTGTLLVDQSDERGFVLVLELIGLEATSLLIDDVLGEIEHGRRHRGNENRGVRFFALPPSLPTGSHRQ